MRVFIVLCIFYVGYSTAINNRSFPKHFMFGVATSAYQIEGGWNADGKGENVWDYLLYQKPYLVRNHDNGNVACDSYHKYKQDVAILKELGVAHYRFSIAWSRILPNGTINNINQAGINYYKKLIKTLRHHSIEPFITLHHWDLPQDLEFIGGFMNEEIVNWFGDYARLCFKEFGHDVKYWVTFNEPKQPCYYGYGVGYLAPGYGRLGIGEYICTHNLIKAHARAYHIYHKEFRHHQKGQVSIGIDAEWHEPETNSDADQEAAEIKRLFMYGWYAHPIVYGDYPDIMKTRIARRSEIQGFARSRLPSFTAEEKATIKGTYDFMCVNSYTSRLVRALANPNLTAIDWDYDAEVYYYQPDTWESTNESFMKVTPWGMRKLLAWISDTYKNPEIIITENGSNDGALELDEGRIRYFQEYLSNVRDAMEYDGVKVFGYTAWSLMDNFEWTAGFTVKFGFYNVDFNNVNKTRTPKQSATFYRNLIKSKCLVDKCETS